MVVSLPLQSSPVQCSPVTCGLSKLGPVLHWKMQCNVMHDALLFTETVMYA